MINKLKFVAAAAMSTFVLGCSAEPANLEEAVTSRLILDLRYYCDEEVDLCDQELTQLPEQWKSLLSNYPIAGVILFAQNLKTIDQMAQLNADIQAAAQRPLIIAVDQEGGRVVRTPLDQSTGFPSALALGAMPPESNAEEAAEQMGAAIGRELLSLGFNTNFAPTVDVNSNPLNPVINVRSFGENPEKVAELGGAFVSGSEAVGMRTSLKHFPGHGDTRVDSHYGLPMVTRSRDEAYAVDLLPFKEIIANESPAMIMTAHIQYPALDGAKVTNMHGEQVYRPATISSSILTGVLRDEFGYEGVVVTDSMGMRAISQQFDVAWATAEAMTAGADIVLMPVKLRTPSDFEQFPQFIEDVANNLRERGVSMDEMDAPLERIDQLLSALSQQPLERSVLREARHLTLEQRITQSSVVACDAIHGIDDDSVTYIVSEVTGLDQVLANELVAKGVQAQAVSLAAARDLKLDESLIVLTQHPNENAIDWGGLEAYPRLTPRIQREQLVDILSSREADKNFIVSLRSPYELERFDGLATRLATFNYKTAVDAETGLATAPLYAFLVELLMGEKQASGVMPVTVPTC